MVWLLILSVFYCLQAWFAGEKVGDGTGKTRREAQRQAAEGSIKKLAGKISYHDISYYSLVHKVLSFVHCLCCACPVYHITAQLSSEQNLLFAILVLTIVTDAHSMESRL